MMPFYAYLCESGHKTEVEQRITEDALTACTQTMTDQNGDKLPCCSPCRRQLSKSSFVLKGGGWSGDGYAKSGKGET